MSAALLASPLVMAEETQAPAAEPAATEETPSADTLAPATHEDLATSPADETEADEGPGPAMGMEGMAMKGGMPGGCMGQPGMAGGKGMMGGKGMKGHKGMMGGMHRGPMGQPAMMDGMPGGMMEGGGGSVMHQHYREVIGRLDLLDARLAKIEAMLERLLQR